jgi:hypothetical protein
MKNIVTLAAVCALAACSAPASNGSASRDRQKTREEKGIVTEEAKGTALKAADDASGPDASGAAVTPGPEVVRMVSGPSFDTTAYCNKIGDTAGGSYLIKLACRDKENKARSDIASLNMSAQTHSYCTKTGETAGGSYQIYAACVEQQSKAPSSF